jgi:hypothetical protein
MPTRLIVAFEKPSSKYVRQTFETRNEQDVSLVTALTRECRQEMPTVNKSY